MVASASSGSGNLHSFAARRPSAPLAAHVSGQATALTDADVLELRTSAGKSIQVTRVAVSPPDPLPCSPFRKASSDHRSYGGQSCASLRKGRRVGTTWSRSTKSSSSLNSTETSSTTPPCKRYFILLL